MSRCNLEGLSVIVIDDNEHMVEIVSLVLRAFRVRDIRLAVDGVDALSMMRSSKPDIVICDLDMRPLSGAEFTKIVRTAPDSPDPYEIGRASCRERV